MIKMLISAPSSGSGKTTVTCAILSLLKRNGYSPCAFKCGPDYIDPMFHRSVLGVDSHNLDLFLSGSDEAKELFKRSSYGCNAVVCEGAMGLYDGVGGSTDLASAWHVADTLDIPIILVIKPKGASLTLAAEINGLRCFRAKSHIKAIILNDCSEMLFKSLSPMIEKETGIPVVGFLPHMEESEINSRHLGLYTATEINDLTTRISKLTDELEKNIDFKKLVSIFEFSDDKKPEYIPELNKNTQVNIAVAYDKAFCFLYKETLECFERLGAKISYFSPLNDKELPKNIVALYIPGGYPELYAKELSENIPMMESIKKSIVDGMPTVAECGGFLYLGKAIKDSRGKEYKMLGLLPGIGYNYGKLVRFGYSNLTAKNDSLLFREGEAIPVHEFHYWESTEIGDDFISCKPVSHRTFNCGYANKSLYAAFPHIYFEGQPILCKRFIDAAKSYLDL